MRGLGTTSAVARFVDVLRRRATLADVTVEVRGVATHPEDDLTLAAAVSSRAVYLVTGDTKLRRFGVCQGVRIVSPRQFLEVLAGEEQPAESLADED